MYKGFGIKQEVLELAKEVEKECVEQFAKIDEIKEINSLKVLSAFQKCGLSEMHLHSSTGYGIDEVGRNKIEQIYAEVFNAEDALVRAQLISGTHALAVTLFGILRPGDTMLSITGAPYDTLQTAIGISQEQSKSSLKKFGIKFVGLFVSIDKINELKFINSEKKLKRFTFVLYLLPGTPKDLLTYFLGLTNLSVRDFLTITLFARIPSIVSSVVGGELIGNREYFKAIVLFIITAAISLIGLKIYKTITEKIKSKSKAKKGIADETAV